MSAPTMRGWRSGAVMLAASALSCAPLISPHASPALARDFPILWGYAHDLDPEVQVDINCGFLLVNRLFDRHLFFSIGRVRDHADPIVEVSVDIQDDGPQATGKICWTSEGRLRRASIIFHRTPTCLLSAHEAGHLLGLLDASEGIMATREQNTGAFFEPTQRAWVEGLK